MSMPITSSSQEPKKKRAVTVYLDDNEYAELAHWAVDERRTVSQQATKVVVDELDARRADRVKTTARSQP
jgi:hypothetical protein